MPSFILSRRLIARRFGRTCEATPLGDRVEALASGCELRRGPEPSAEGRRSGEPGDIAPDGLEPAEERDQQQARIQGYAPDCGLGY